MSIPQRILRRLHRLVEAPPVRERLVVKAAPQRAEHLKPGFVIGVYRSGTTLLRYVLDSHSHIAVPPETNFLTSLAALSDDAWLQKGMSGLGLDEDGLNSHLRDFCWNPLDDYASAKGKQRWIDKTPSYTNILPFLDHMFGSECRYLMLYRHGLDVANSMSQGHANGVIYGPTQRYVIDAGVSPQLGYSRYWAEQCQKMMAFEAAHPSQCLRVRYEDYASEPEVWLPRVFAFLGEEWEAEVLDFNAQSHDYGLQDHKIAETQGFKPSVGNYKKWPQAEIDAAAAAIGPTLSALGYTV